MDQEQSKGPPGAAVGRVRHFPARVRVSTSRLLPRPHPPRLFWVRSHWNWGRGVAHREEIRALQDSGREMSQWICKLFMFLLTLEYYK